MKNFIAPFNWRAELEDQVVDSIGDDFVLLDRLYVTPTFNNPFKLDVSVGIICTRGVMKGMIDLKTYSAQAPCLVIIMADQILQYEYISEDFMGYIISMSRKFTDSLFMNLQERFPLKHSVLDNPWIRLSQDDLELMTDYCRMLQKAIRMKDNPYRLEIVKNLTRAFFYGSGYQYHKIPDNRNKTKNEILLEKFLGLLQDSYKEEREVGFYADKLYLTPKYLSKVIKETSGDSASSWIDKYVILEARALLNSTHLTIQQISDELHFPSQSFFGKYFKRHVGLSPKEYRKN
jgi:AraC family transcriptional regulator, transcriptional activator of pobA